MNYIKNAIKYFLPHGIFVIREKYLQRNRNNKRLNRIEEYEKIKKGTGENIQYSYQDSISHLLSMSLNENEIRAGSIPEEDLKFITNCIDFKNNLEIKVLHIGNFVGISLAYILNYVKNINKNSIVFAIDPNMEHRGILNPVFYVKTLLERYGFGDNTILIDGFSLSRNLKNDGGLLYSEDKNISNDFGCSNVLPNISTIMNNKIDIIILDGNHSYDYLNKEIIYSKLLLKDGGYLVLDDVSNAWPEIKKIFSEILKSSIEFNLINHNGRVGIFQYVNSKDNI